MEKHFIRKATLYCLSALWLLHCDVMQVNPGEDFQLTLLSTSEIEINQRVTPIEIKFRLEGCDQFSTVLQKFGLTLSSEKQIDIEKTGAKEYRTLLSLDWLRNAPEICLADQENPLQTVVQLVAICSADGRKAQSKQIVVTDAPAWKTSFFEPGPVEYLFSLGNNQDYLLLGSGWIDFSCLQSDLITTGFPRSIQSGERPLLFRTGRKYMNLEEAFLWTGCPEYSCGYAFEYQDTEGLTRQVEATHLHPLGYEVRSPNCGSTILWGKPIQIPQKAIDLLVDDDDQVVVLSADENSPEIDVNRACVYVSQFGREGLTSYSVLHNRTRASTLWKTEDGVVQFIAFPDEIDSPELQDTGYLYSLNNDLPIAFQWPGSGCLMQFSMGPDATKGILHRGAQVWIGSWNTEWVALESKLSIDCQALTIEWWDSYVLIASEGGIELFDTMAPFPMHYHHELDSLIPGKDPPKIIDVQVAKDRLVATTDTGIRVLDREGQLVGGIEPLPCNFKPTANAVILGGEVAIVAGREYLYILDLSSM